MGKNIEDLLGKLNIKPHNLAVYIQAFTHPTYNSDKHFKIGDYQRLEFLGDSILGFVVASLLYKDRKDLDEGSLSQVRSALVKTNSLASISLELELDQYVRVGSAFAGKVSDQKHLLEDIFEALVGAIYVDLGIKEVTAFVTKIFEDKVKVFDPEDAKDPKSRLQEYFQSAYNNVVKYTVLAEAGPTNNRLFKVQVSYDNFILGVGEGKSKKEAEFEAAINAIKKGALNYNGPNKVSKK